MRPTRILIILLLLISAFSFNKNEEASKTYYENGIRALSVNDYVDALLYFSRAYTLSPKSEYGELSYLYYGLSYALYSYNLGNKEGIFSAIGFLNLYTFHYKSPRYLTLQREFVGDSYFLLGWYDRAMDIYASLYGDTRDERFIIKFALASALFGDYTGYTYVKRLGKIPREYAYLYYLALGVYEVGLGKYESGIENLRKALELNSFLKYDVHFNYYTAFSHYRLGNLRKALFYFTRAKELDKFGFYRIMLNYYLTELNLKLNNFSEAYSIYEEIKKELFYNSVYRILYLKYWKNKEFLKRFREFRFYYDVVLQIGWLSTGKPYENFVLFALYNKAIEEKKIGNEEKEFLRIVKFRRNPFVLLGEIFGYDEEIEILNKKILKLKPYVYGDLITELYRLNRKNFLSVFNKPSSIEVLARALLYRGDNEFLKVVELLPRTPKRKFLRGLFWFSKGRKEVAERLLKESVEKLEGVDKLEALLILSYLEENNYIDEVVKLAREYERLKGYFPHIYKLAGDIYYGKGMYRKAIEMYRAFLKEYKRKNDVYGAVLIKLGYSAEKLHRKDILSEVLKEAEDFKKPWREVILSLWGG
ncbi:hypothetical protein JCM9492_13810 [Aquifex pyrophilus]